MARVAFEDFGDGEEVVRIYLARELGEAKRVEAVLTEKGIEYAVEVEPYVTAMSNILSSEYNTREQPSMWSQTKSNSVGVS